MFVREQHMYLKDTFLLATRFPHYRHSVIKSLPRSHQDERPRNGQQRSCRYLHIIDTDTSLQPAYLLRVVHLCTSISST